MRSEATTPSFLLVSNHGQALIAIAENPDVRLREIAERLGITERATQSIVNDLVDAGYVRRTRVGRRNVYTVDSDQPFPHPALRQSPVRSLLAGLVAWTDGGDDPLDELTGQPHERPAEELARALEPDDALDRLTSLAAMLLHVPVSFVAVIEGDVEVIASGIGLPEEVMRRELPLEESVCQHVVSGRAPMVVSDTSEHKLLAKHAGLARHGLRAYAGLPLLAADGTAFGSLCVADTTPRRWSQNEVRMLASLSAAAASQIEVSRVSRRHEQAAARYRMLLNSVPEALIMVLDRDLRVEMISGSLLERTGKAPDQLVGRWLGDIVSPERVTEVVGHYARGLAGDRHEFDTSADGGETWFTLDVVPLRDSDGTVTGVMSIAREQLVYGRGDQWDAERLRALIENVPGAIYRVLPDANWTVEFMSDQIEAITGYPASEFLHGGRSFNSVVHPEDVEMVDAKLRRALAERVPFKVEYRVVRRDGQARWVRERGQGIHDEQGTVLWVDGAIFAIDEAARLAA